MKRYTLNCKALSLDGATGIKLKSSTQNRAWSSSFSDQTQAYHCAVAGYYSLSANAIIHIVPTDLALDSFIEPQKKQERNHTGRGKSLDR